MAAVRPDGERRPARHAPAARPVLPPDVPESFVACTSAVDGAAPTYRPALLGSGRYPVRNVSQNLADLRAQLTALPAELPWLDLRRRALDLLARIQKHTAHIGDRTFKAASKPTPEQHDLFDALSLSKPA